MTQDLDQIFGASGRGEYPIGEHITFQEDGVELTGEVIHITAPGTSVSGHYLPLTYDVDAGDGFPHIVLSEQIIAR